MDDLSGETEADRERYTQVAEDPGQPLQAGDRLYHEIIAQTSCSLKNRLVSLFRIAVAINISLTSGGIRDSLVLYFLYIFYIYIKNTIFFYHFFLFFYLMPF